MRTVPIHVSCAPAFVSVRSVEAWLNGRTIAVASGPPWAVTLDGAAMPEGKHELKVRVRLSTGAFEEHTSRFTVTHPRFLVHFPGAPARLDAVRTLVPVVVDEEGIGLDRVEYEVNGTTIPASGPEWALTLDPHALPEGALRIRARAVRKDRSHTEHELDLDVVRPREINLFVTARRTGELVRPAELDRVDLTVKIDDTPVPAASVTRSPATELPLAFALVLDCSGSMAEDEKFPRAREAAAYFLDLKRADDDAALVTFADAARVVSPLGRDRTTVKQALERMSPEGTTALYDGLVAGIDQVRRAGQRRAIFLLSDGVDQNRAGTGPGSRATLDEVIHRAREAGAPIYAIGVGQEMRARGGTGERVLLKIARATGGGYLFAPGGSALRGLFGQFADQVQSQTRVRVSSPALAEGRVYRVSVSSSLAGIELVYPAEVTAQVAR